MLSFEEIKKIWQDYLYKSAFDMAQSIIELKDSDDIASILTDGRPNPRWVYDAILEWDNEFLHELDENTQDYWHYDPNTNQINCNEDFESIGRPCDFIDYDEEIEILYKGKCDAIEHEYGENWENRYPSFLDKDYNIIPGPLEVPSC